MNHFVYNTLNAIYLGISKDSFLVLKKWYNTNLFMDVYHLFCLPTFKNLEALEKEKIYSRINELRVSEVTEEEKKRWLVTCLEQLESLEHGDLKRTLKNKCKEE